MRRIPLSCLVIALVLPLTAGAQVYKWTDPVTGQRVISDTPQPGTPAARRARQASDAAAAEPPPQTAPAKAAAVGSVDPELEKRRQAQEAKEKAELAAQEAQRAEAIRKDCAGARQNLGSLKSGERIALRDDKGERYFMDDAQRLSEIQRHERFLSENCAGK